MLLHFMHTNNNGDVTYTLGFYLLHMIAYIFLVYFNTQEDYSLPSRTNMKCFDLRFRTIRTFPNWYLKWIW